MEILKIRLNNKFYSKKAIDDSLLDFRDICEGKRVSDEFDVELKAEKKVENLREEFCNYVLGIVKNNM